MAIRLFQVSLAFARSTIISTAIPDGISTITNTIGSGHESQEQVEVDAGSVDRTLGPESSMKNRRTRFSSGLPAEVATAV